jgi:hypothetical protein
MSRTGHSLLIPVIMCASCQLLPSVPCENNWKVFCDEMIVLKYYHNVYFKLWKNNVQTHIKIFILTVKALLLRLKRFMFCVSPNVSDRSVIMDMTIILDTVLHHRCRCHRHHHLVIGTSHFELQWLGQEHCLPYTWCWTQIQVKNNVYLKPQDIGQRPKSLSCLIFSTENWLH